MKQIVLTLLVFLLSQIAATAQRFDNIRLPNARTIYAVAQDDDGIVWLGTERGLYSYDGYHITPYPDTSGYASGHVNALLIVGDTIYVGGEHGLQTYSITTGRYTVACPDGPYEVRALVKHRGVTIVGSNEGLYRYDPAGSRCVKLCDVGGTVYSLLSLGDTLYAGSTSGLYRIDGNKPVAVTLPSRSALVNALLVASDQRVWIGTEGNLLVSSGGAISVIAALQGHSVKSLLEHNGVILAGTDAGLFVIEGSRVTRLEHDIDAPSSLASNIVWTLARDRSGNLWVGTDNGLSVRPHFTFIDFRPLSQFTARGDGCDITTLLEDSRGGLWMGGTNGVIYLPQPRDPAPAASMVWYKQDSPNPLPHNRVRRIMEDARGNVIICSDHGLSIKHAGSERLTNVVVTDTATGATALWCYDIVDDGCGHYWIATYGNGVFAVDTQALLEGQGSVAAARHFTRELYDINALQLALDGNHNVWVSLASCGAAMIDPRTMQVAHQTTMGVAQLAADNQGNIWIGGYGQIERYDIARSSLMHWDLPTREAPGVLALTPVSDQMWVFLPHECFVMDSTGQRQRYSAPLADFYTATYAHRDSAIIVGSHDGIARLAPPRTTDTKPRLLLTDIIVNDEQYVATGVSYRYMKTLTLRHDQNHITLYLSDLPLDGNPPLVYRCRLEGIDKEWQNLDPDRLEINYNGLPHGTYNLQVAVTDVNDNILSLAYELKIKILPPWYLSWWARLLYLALLALIVGGIYKYYHVRRRLKAERMARQHSLEQSQLRMQFFENLANVIHNPLSRIIGLVSELIKDERNDNLSRIKDASLELSDFIDKSLNFEVQPTHVVNLTNQAGDDADESADVKFLKEVTRIIEQHISEPDFNVSSLTDTMGMGSKMIYRRLKQLTGMTPVEFMRDIRMQKAALLLAEGRFSVSEVTYMVGYSNSGYFSRCFQKAFGLTPKEYAQRQR